jgi:hypothetical protein
MFWRTFHRSCHKFDSSESKDRRAAGIRGGGEEMAHIAAAVDQQTLVCSGHTLPLISSSNIVTYLRVRCHVRLFTVLPTNLPTISGVSNGRRNEINQTKFQADRLP